jgi:hypothetical protein
MMDEGIDPRPREVMTSRIIIALPFVLVAILAGYFWAEWQRKPSRPDTVTWSGEQSLFPHVERELTLVYPSIDGEWITERRTIRGFETERQEMQSCLDAFLTGPVSPDARLPGRERMRIAGIYLDGKKGLIINLETDYEPLNIGGVNAEYSFIQSLIQTMKTNYPSLDNIRLMVNGSVHDTLAGHIDIRKSFVTGM